MGDQGHMSQLLGSISDLFMPFDDHQENSIIQSSFPCTSRQYSCLAQGDISPQGLSIRFMTSCTTNEPDLNSHQQRLSPTTSQSVRYPESSQRTTSAFQSSLQYDPQNLDYFTSSSILSSPVPHTTRRASHIPPTDRGWISGQDVEQINSAPRLDIQPLKYPNTQTSTGRAQMSSDSAFTEYTFPDESDMENGLVMSQMMIHFQVHTPSLNVDTPMRIVDQGLATPSIMTFRLGRQSLRPVTDPDNARILESFDNPDEDASEGSCESLSPSSTPLYSSSSFHDRRAVGNCGNIIGRTVTEVTPPRERCRTPDNDHSFSGPNGNLHDAFAPVTKQRTSGSSKRSKMHECEICHKNFPRPSGLHTHMNSHSGAKPYKCPVSSCDKRFAVRSNAKRHLKTHGINPSLIEGPSQGSNFTVGFEEPLVNHHVHDVGRPPTRLRWIPHSLATRTQPGADWIGSPSSGGDKSETTYPVLSVLLPADSSSSNRAVYHYDNMNSYADARSHYHSNQVRPRRDSED